MQRRAQYVPLPVYACCVDVVFRQIQSIVLKPILEGIVVSSADLVMILNISNVSKRLLLVKKLPQSECFIRNRKSSQSAF
ncbi:unnamed protein product, partial [Schistosoma bovis]